jgi:hypothetical protein
LMELGGEYFKLYNLQFLQNSESDQIERQENRC